MDFEMERVIRIRPNSSEKKSILTDMKNRGTLIFLHQELAQVHGH